MRRLVVVLSIILIAGVKESDILCLRQRRYSKTVTEIGWIKMIFEVVVSMIVRFVGGFQQVNDLDGRWLATIAPSQHPGVLIGRWLAGWQLA